MFEYKYDSLGNESEMILLDKDYKPYYHIYYTYDSLKRKVEVKVKESLKIERYKYDNNNNLIQKSFYDLKQDTSIIYTNKYKYNKNRDWIYQIRFYRNTPRVILEREINYY
jgi:hypothetical protein